MVRASVAFGLVWMLAALPCEASASPGRLWIGSSTVVDPPTEREEALAALVEGDLGVSVTYRRTAPNGQLPWAGDFWPTSGTHPPAIPVTRLDSFFERSQLTAALIEAWEDDFEVVLLYLPDEGRWGELSGPEASERFSDALAVAAVLLAGAELPSVDGLSPLAAEGVDQEIFLLADGPHGGEGPRFTLQVVADGPLNYPGRVSGDSYDFLDPAGFQGELLTGSKPEVGLRTPKGDFEIWAYSAVSDAEWVDLRETLVEQVGLYRTWPLVPPGH